LALPYLRRRYLWAADEHALLGARWPAVVRISNARALADELEATRR
jgi:hypothetical protein